MYIWKVKCIEVPRLAYGPENEKFLKVLLTDIIYIFLTETLLILYTYQLDIGYEVAYTI